MSPQMLGEARAALRLPERRCSSRHISSLMQLLMFEPTPDK